jgi:flagellar motor switch protein FliM
VNQILSQDEVDALLRGLDTGEVETEKDAFEGESDLQPYDWATQGRNLKGNMPILGVINGRFAQILRHALSSSLRKMVDVEAGPIELIKFEEFQRSLPIPTSLHLFKMSPLRGMGILVIASRLVFNLVEAYFGGSGTGSTKVEGREFTPIEKRIIEKVVSMALANMGEAWEDVFPIQTEFVRAESNPLGVNVVPPSEFLITVKFEVELTKSAGSIILCLPYSSIQPIREKFSGSYHREEGDTDKLWVGDLQERLMETQVEFSVDLGKSSLSIKDFLNMKVGDIVVLEKEVQEVLTGKVGGIPKFVGYAGRHRDRKVFKVEDVYPSVPRQ